MNPTSKFHESWKPLLSYLETDPMMKKLSQEILPNTKYYPEKEDIFNVFQMPVEDIKVVILGQDPYPNEGQAIGYAFAVSEDTPKPASLKIIEKEIGSVLDRTLSHWTGQGVFLLNTALTVKVKEAGSHLQYWDGFIKQVISFISLKNRVVWLLWGKKAQAFTPYITRRSEFKTLAEIADFNIILNAAHPAAEAYSGGKAGFYGCNHFNLVNEILQQQQKSTIVW